MSTVTYGIDLTHRAAVVFGGDARALGHVAELRQAGATVTVVSPEAVASIEDLADRGLIQWDRRAYATTDLDSVWIAVAVTNDPISNLLISTDA
ncbi:MAG: cobA, partial [Nocardioidaceae bacterium]|nr:cobA [Nocardioidaceae bacterium]